MKLTTRNPLLFCIIWVILMSNCGIISAENENNSGSDWCTPTTVDTQGERNAIWIVGIVEFKGKQMCHSRQLLLDSNGTTSYDYYATQDNEEVWRVITYPDGRIVEAAIKKPALETEKEVSDESSGGINILIDEEKLMKCMNENAIPNPKDGEVLERIGNNALKSMEKHFNNGEYDRAKTCMEIASEIFAGLDKQSKIQHIDEWEDKINEAADKEKHQNELIIAVVAAIIIEVVAIVILFIFGKPLYKRLEKSTEKVIGKKHNSLKHFVRIFILILVFFILLLLMHLYSSL